MQSIKTTVMADVSFQLMKTIFFFLVQAVDIFWWGFFLKAWKFAYWLYLTLSFRIWPDPEQRTMSWPCFDMTWHDMIWLNWLYMQVLPGSKFIKTLLIWHQHGRELQFRYPSTKTCYDMTWYDMTWHFHKNGHFSQKCAKNPIKIFLNGNCIIGTFN